MSSETDWMVNRWTDPSAIDPRAPAGGTGPGYSSHPGPLEAPQPVESYKIGGHIIDFAKEFKDAEDCVEHTVDVIKFIVIDAGQRIVGKMAFKTGHFNFWDADLIKNAEENLRGIVKSAVMRKFYDNIIWAEEKFKGAEKRLFILGLASELNAKADEFKAIWNSTDNTSNKVARITMVVSTAILKCATGTIPFGTHLGIQALAWGSDQIGSTFHSDNTLAFAWALRQQDQNIQSFVDKKMDGEYISSEIQMQVFNFMVLDMIHSGQRLSGDSARNTNR
jgi:hypothetical protein